jgi:putative ABC transport system permease protein
VRFRDLLRLALSALYQQKVRTVLTTLGVVAGCFVLLASLSVRTGVQDLVRRQHRRFGELRRIDVHPGYSAKDEDDLPAAVKEVRGKMSEARRKRFRQRLISRYREQHGARPAVRLTADRLKALAALEHVRAVAPMVTQPGRLYLGKRSERVTAMTALPGEDWGKRLVAGRGVDPGDPRGVVVNEFVLYLLGVTDEDDVARVVGREVRLECSAGGAQPSLLLLALNRQADALTAPEERVLARLQARLPDLLRHLDLKTPEEAAAAKRLLARPSAAPGAEPARFEEAYTVRGVSRLMGLDEATSRYDWAFYRADLYLAPAAAARLYAHYPDSGKEGYAHAVVEVDSVDHVKEVAEQIRATGLNAFTPVDFIERERLILLLFFSGLTAIAAVSLLVAALGIINTMLMSVLERVREIGVMKAVGARDAHIQLIFLVEGALVGLAGGLGGVLLGWAASFPGDAWVRGLVRQHLSLNLTESIFVFPWWLVVGVPAFACLVTTLAALYPARRAARVNPITALRHD